MIVWRAFGNMLRAARRDPVWAISALILLPLSYGKFFLYRLLWFAIVAVVLLLAVLAASHWLRLQAGSFPQIALNLLYIGIVAIYGFRLITNPIVQHFGSSASGTHGTARFATKQETRDLVKESDGLLIGRDTQSGKMLRYSGPAHLLTIAPNRKGKGVGAIIPNLLTARRSVICIDPKGENARITARQREKFGPVHVLDPFGITGQPQAAFNPLAWLTPSDLDVAEDATTIADALVYDPPGEAGEAHWNEEAKALITGVMLYIVAEEPEHRRNLGTLREYLTAAPETFTAMLQRMQGITAMNGLVARAANRHLGKSSREASGVLSAAQRHTHFLDSPRMTTAMARSDFAFESLKRTPTTVYLVLPTDRLEAYSRWLRLLVTLSLRDMARSLEKPASPVLFLLDEFAALGRLASIERAMGLMAGYGVQLWPIVQDVSQLRDLYNKRIGTFFANAEVLQVFGVNDHEGAKLFSDMLGQQTVVFQTMSRALDSDLSGLTYAEHHHGRPLLTPDEVRVLPMSRELLFLAGRRPIVADKLAHYQDREFSGMYDRID